MAIAPDATPYVAWYHWSNGAMEIFVRRWNGAAWVEVGAGSASGGGISNNSTASNMPSIDVAPNGSPIVAWQDETNGVGNYEIFVRQWNGSAWIELGGSASGGGISNTIGRSVYPAIAVAADGKPIVAWSEAISDDVMEIYVRRWNGTAWVEMGTGSASGGGISDTKTRWASNPSLVITSSGTPIVAWDGLSQIYALRWNGAAWVEMGTGSASGGGISVVGSSWNSSLAVGLDGYPVVTWQYHGAGEPQKIYLRRWNGSEWAQLGGSATGNGIGAGWGPAVDVVAAGNWPVVVWADNSNGDYEIYARRWNGSAWIEHSGGSAGGGGISDNAGDSTTPSLAVAGSWAYVAWEDGSSGESEIYVRRSAPITAICYFLTLEHNGQGSNPTASPTNSPGCGTGYYSAGQVISLSASPASGWRVKNWGGTANNASTAATNSLTMPAASHTVSVTYETIPSATNRAFAPAVLNRAQTCWPGPNEVEPNNTANDANGPICPGSVIRGLPNDRWDMYYFETTRAGDVAATLTDYFGGGMQLHLYYGAIGGSPSSLDTDDGDGLQATLRGAPPGRYYIAIYTETPNPAETRRYRLQVSIP
jgi:hypothetical protein